MDNIKICINKNVYIIIAIIFLMTVLTGCWNQKELHQLGIVGAAAIDAQNGDVRVTFELIQPKNMSDSGGSKERASYFQSSGESVFDAMRNATLKTDKKLYWPHINVYYFNEESVKAGMTTYMDFLNRDHESKRYVNIAIAKGCPASDLIGISGSKSDIPSMYAESLFENYNYNGKSVSIRLMDFLRTYYQEGVEPVIGVMQVVPRNDSTLKVPVGENGEYMLSNEGCAVFNNDKFIGYLDGFETRGYNFATGKLKSSIVVSNSSDEIGKNVIEIIKSASKMEVKVQDDKPLGKITIEINGTLGEETGKENISNLEGIKKIEEGTSEVVKSEVLKTIKKVQSFKSDIFGFGASLHRSKPKEWDKMKSDWDEIFSELEIEVIVKTSIKRVGQINEQMTYNSDKSKKDIKK